MEGGGGSRTSKKSLEGAVKLPKQVQDSPPQVRVVIVMDALRDYSLLPLLWALENIIRSSGCVVTLLGIMPWLNIPLSSKTPEVWAVEFEELATAQSTSGVDMDPKYFKLQAIVDLCNRFGVEINKEVVMGFPLKLVVVEKITSLHATWVVFDRHQRRNRGFFANRIPCNMVMMNENGEADMIRGQPMMTDNGDSELESPASLLPTPQLIIPKQWNDNNPTS
ncbi:hypothetical protein M5689_002870 [Euphorbia peplus]|nr:hypothetical protein M5689_002870 [Euphorbia peplus]